MSQQIIQSDMEVLRQSLRKFADDQKLEIESLKEKENYRKEFIGNISHELNSFPLLEPIYAGRNINYG